MKGARALVESTPGRTFLACLAAQGLSIVASALWSSNPALSIAGSSWRRDGLIAESALLLFAFIVAAWLAEDRRRVITTLRTAVVVGAAASVYGVSQYFGWDPFLPPQAYQSGEGPFTIVRPPGTMGHADYFANWLVIVAFFALALARIEEDRPCKAMAKAGMGLAIFALVLSGTRSALLGLVAGVIVFSFIARPRIDRKLAVTLTAAIVCLGTLYVSPAGTKLRARVHWSLDDIWGGARILLWRDSLHMARQRPMLGFGPETFTAQFPLFESVELARAYPDFYHESPHNMFLDALTSRGLPGLLSLVALCLLAVWAARKDAALSAGLAGAIVCQQFMVLTIPTALYFYLLIAIVIAHVAPSRPIAARPFPYGIMTVAVAIAAMFLVFTTRLILADRAMALAERRTAAGDVNGAASEYQAAQRWDRWTGDRDLRYSRAMARLASTTHVFATSVAAAQQAFESGIRATTIAEDRQNAWYNLAMIAALRSDPSGVENGLRRAIASAPNWFKPHWTLAQFLELTGRHAEARREAAIAMELDGGHDAEVAESSRKILSRP